MLEFAHNVHAYRMNVIQRMGKCISELSVYKIFKNCM